MSSGALPGSVTGSCRLEQFGAMSLRILPLPSTRFGCRLPACQLCDLGQVLSPDLGVLLRSLERRMSASPVRPEPWKSVKPACNAGAGKGVLAPDLCLAPVLIKFLLPRSPSRGLGSRLSLTQDLDHRRLPPAPAEPASACRPPPDHLPPTTPASNPSPFPRHTPGEALPVSADSFPEKSELPASQSDSGHPERGRGGNGGDGPRNRQPVISDFQTVL